MRTVRALESQQPSPIEEELCGAFSGVEPPSLCCLRKRVRSLAEDSDAVV